MAEHRGGPLSKHQYHSMPYVKQRLGQEAGFPLEKHARLQPPLTQQSERPGMRELLIPDNIMNFREALIASYCENPCHVLPNSLWKTLARLENLHTAISIENDIVNHLHAWNENQLVVYWTRNREPAVDFRQKQTNLTLALVHQDYLPVFPYVRFAGRKPYFRLLYKQKAPEVKTSLPTGFSLMDVNIGQEAQKVSELIGQCYQDIHPTADVVMRWVEYPVFEPALWIWVIDEVKEVPIGLGIAEIDHNISEGSLEWIQVLPEYRRKGIGICIVQELLSRLGKRVMFTTVTGEVDNITNPEALYRRCGFEGDDIWWVFRT